MRKIQKLSALLLVVCLLTALAPQPVQAANPAGVRYLNTYENTGDQRKDILNIALTQMGYTEKTRNDTKYGDWGGYARQPWCANFVSWCARQADISGSIITKSARARPDYFNVPYYHGTEYTPQPGDLFFTEGFTHVGFVWYVEGEFFYTVEGNAKYHDYMIPDDPEEDSYYVMSNKRLIASYYFGVPNYMGAGDHHYEKSFESTHPHKEYYLCDHCGDMYYTGYNHVLSNCRKCITCGCYDQGAGYYMVNSSAESYPVKLRKSHSTSADHVGYVSTGEVVYVYASTGSWAYVDYDGLRGHLPLRYLTPYYDKPEAPQVEADEPLYQVFMPVTLTWTKPANTEKFRLRLYRDETLELDTLLDSTSYTNDTLPAGNYRVELSACNCTGASTATTQFRVVEDYSITYHSDRGSDIPQTQHSQNGKLMDISRQLPQCEGYTFLGWTDDPTDTMVTHYPGQATLEPRDLALYAVWRENTAAPETLKLLNLPNKTLYVQNEPLDTTGLLLEYRYSDGSGFYVTEGFGVEGYDSALCATQTLTVSYLELQVAYDVQVIDHIPGDMDGNRQVDRDDVMQLLWHITFPELYPLDLPADFVADGKINRDDVMQLLWHVTFPEMFPLS